MQRDMLGFEIWNWNGGSMLLKINDMHGAPILKFLAVKLKSTKGCSKRIIREATLKMLFDLYCDILCMKLKKRGLANAWPTVIWPYGTAYLFLAISSLPSAGFPLWVN